MGTPELSKRTRKILALWSTAAFVAATLVSCGNSDGDDGKERRGNAKPLQKSESSSHTFKFDIKQDSLRIRGTLDVEIGQPIKNYAPCSLSAGAGYSIVPVTVTYTNRNKPAPTGPDSVRPALPMVGLEIPDYITDYENPVTNCEETWTLDGKEDIKARIGMKHTEKLILTSIPENREITATFTVAADWSNHSIEGDLIKKKFPVRVHG